MVRIIVKTVEGTNNGETQRTLRSVLECSAAMGLTLIPLHPATRDAALSTYFYLDVQDKESQEVIEFLRAVEGVDGAYTKPQDEPP